MFYEFLLCVATLAVWLHWRLRGQCKAFDEAGVRYARPYPLFGNLLGVVLRREHIADTLKNALQKFPDDKYIGLFNFMTPVVVVQDAELIRDITIKDYTSFYDHSLQISNDVEPLFGRSLVSLKGKKWREMRASLSPAFTSSKMRNMFCFMTECANNMVAYYGNLCAEVKSKSGKSVVELEAREMVTRFTTDVIASAAFGLKVDSYKEQDNVFFKMGQIVSSMNIPKFLGYMSHPKLMKFFRISLIPEYCCTFFKSLLRDTMKQREEQNIYRPDMVHLLMEVKKGTLKDDESPKNEMTEIERDRELIKTSWTDDDLAAQAMLFFLAGFEAATITTNFLFHTFMQQPDVQQKLYREVLETRKQVKEDVTYETIHSMKYLDMVISEIMRRWLSGSGFNDRCCTIDYVLPPAREGANEFKLKKGAIVWMSSSAIHMRSKYWSEPEKFDPERFSTENKQKIVPFSYIPFGSGPRLCIGNRFALMELKVLAYYIVNNFEVLKSPKSKDNIELDPSSLNIRVKDGVWFNLKLRDNAELLQKHHN